MIEKWLGEIFAGILSGVAALLGFAINRLYARLDKLDEKTDKLAEKTKEYITRTELSEKLEDKLEAIKQRQESLTEDIHEIKEMLKRG